MKSLLIALASAVFLDGSLAAATAQAPGPCRSDSFNIDGTPLAATFCVTADNRSAKPPTLTVTETFRSGATTFSRNVTIDVLPGAVVSRTADDVPLDRIGSSKVLHLTLLERNGVVSAEHALLLPGARVLK